jgi:hypothetical protein
VKVFTRRGHDWTNRFKRLADDAWESRPGRPSWTAKRCDPRRDDLVYAGKVDHGFDRTIAREALL